MQLLFVTGAISMLALGGSAVKHIGAASGISGLEELGNSAVIIFTAILTMFLFFVFLELAVFAFDKLLNSKNKSPRTRGGRR